MVRKKRFSRIILIYTISALLLMVMIYWWYWANLPMERKASREEVFVIKPGESVDSIGQRLDRVGLIRSIAAFKLSVLVQGVSRNIQAGSFSLSSDLPLSQLVKQLTHGTLDFWVTIPEGLRREEIAVRITQQASSKQAVFDEATFLRLTEGWEGQLFPDTYLIPQGADTAEILAIFTANFDEKIAGIENETNLNQTELIILASLIEREAKHNDDRPIIAGILINRLRAGWPLQIDATVQYALGWQVDQQTWWKKNLTLHDLQIDSPFNTYKNLGLPPEPICNPGLNSLSAAANPQDTDFWFYLADDEGITHFARTIEEHNQNIERYLTK